MKTFRTEAWISGFLAGVGLGVLFNAWILFKFMSKLKTLSTTVENKFNANFPIIFLICGLIFIAIGIIIEVYYHRKLRNSDPNKTD